MRAFLRLSFLFAASTTLGLVTGCGDGAPPAPASSTEVTVKGVVKVDGAPASEGEIVFDPSNAQRPGVPRRAPIGQDGSYSIKTLSGQNDVRLAGSLASKNQILQQKHKPYEVPGSDGTLDIEFDTK